jgi:peptide methionine sulfoxide reductase msrA/msrB
MDFFSGIFLSISSFFGFNEPAMLLEPVAVVQEVSVEEVSGLPIASEETDEDEMAMQEDVESATPTDEPQELEGVAEMAGTGVPAEELPAVTPDIQTMIVAGGCFWCVEADLEKTYGVIEVVSGYSGGSADNPTYSNYGSGGHREVVEVTYDANQISFEEILIVTMKTTDPTDDDGTFGDRGDKYSSAFYYETSEQKKIIETLIEEVDEFGPYDKPLAIDIETRAKFWAAEDYHQNYYKGSLSKLKYGYYRNASGRNDFIIKYWGENDQRTELSWRSDETTSNNQTYMWSNYIKPSQDEIKSQLDDVAYKVTQKDGTEKPGSSPLDKNWEEGIYVDILSGEPLYSSKDKFDSGTGWPSFVRPITEGALTELEDRKLFSVRTETRSAIGDNHIGHVFNDGPQDSTGLRYCMNGAALKFIPKADMDAEGYGDFLKYL